MSKHNQQSRKYKGFTIGEILGHLDGVIVLYSGIIYGDQSDIMTAVSMLNMIPPRTMQLIEDLVNDPSPPAETVGKIKILLECKSHIDNFLAKIKK